MPRHLRAETELLTLNLRSKPQQHLENEKSEEKVWRGAVDGCKRLADYAAERGVRVTFEPLGALSAAPAYA